MSHAIAIDGIKRKADWVRKDAADLARYVEMLDALPQWPTRAEHEVNRAEAELAAALESVRAIRAELACKRPALEAAE